MLTNKRKKPPLQLPPDGSLPSTETPAQPLNLTSRRRCVRGRGRQAVRWNDDARSHVPLNGLVNSARTLQSRNFTTSEKPVGCWDL